MIDITKEQFDIVSKKHQPNGWIRFAFRYFSKYTVEKDLSIKNNIVNFLLWLFLIGFLCVMFNAPRMFIGIATMTFSIVLTVLILYLFSAVILNKIRINRIRKELGITKKEYEIFSNIYNF